MGSIGISRAAVPCYSRLRDREQRRGVEFYRKRVYLKETFDSKSIVLQFHPDYRSLMDSYLRAYRILPPELIGRVLAVDQEGLILEIEHLGIPIGTDQNSLARAVAVLGKINGFGRRPMRFLPPRYISELQTMQLTELRGFNEFVDLLKTNLPLLEGGYGIEDPVLSNFTTKDGEIFLVDMDNVGDHYHADALVGFMTADVLYEQEVMDVSPLNVIGIGNDLKKDIVNPIPFLSGYMGRAAVAVIDASGPASSARQMAVNQLNQFAIYTRQLIVSST